MKRVRIYPFKVGSESARSLARELGVLCVKPDGRYRPRFNDLIINWGNSSIPSSWGFGVTEVLNYPLSVKFAINKLTTFEMLQREGVPTVEWTTSMDVAWDWRTVGNTVVERHNVTGTRGDGIVIRGEAQGIDNAPLYTKLIERAREYRVHVFDGRVIDIQQKKRRVMEEGNDSDGTVKNLANGWVFVRDDITPPPRAIFDVAVRAVEALGLDFGGVDILTKDGQCYCLEVNTAVGLEGATITSYVSAIQRYANKL